MTQANARAPRADNPLADPPRPRFRLVEAPSEPERESVAADPEERARAEYIERLAASPERPELTPSDSRKGRGRRTIRVNGRPHEAASRDAPSLHAFEPRTARARDRRGLAPIAAAQLAARPDRVGMWAVMLGLFLAFMAVATGAQ